MDGDDNVPSGFPMPFGPPPEGRAAADLGASTATYNAHGRGPVRYLPVHLAGEVIGYLYGSVRGSAASYIRRLGAQPTLEGAEGAVEWARRLGEAYREGLTPRQALERWIGAEEHPRAGAVPADAVFAEADTIEALEERVNPNHVEPAVPKGLQVGSEGAPLDGGYPESWGPIAPLRSDYPEGYLLVSRTPVRYLPVVRDGVPLGYVWAAESDDAAGFQPHPGAGEAGQRAKSAWISRFERFKAEGVLPLEGMRRMKGAPEDPVAGGVPADAEEKGAKNSKALGLLGRD